MATPLRTPRVNNNDDSVRLVKVLVKHGDHVDAGQLVAEVETDKANFTVESDRSGYILAINRAPGDIVDVGSVLLWLGAREDEPVPADGQPSARPAIVRTTAEPTLKAAHLLAQHGLSASDVPGSGGPLTVADVEAFLARQGGAAPNVPPGVAPGTATPLTPEQRGMLRTVLWQRQEAVTGYVELTFDALAWDQAAAEFQKREKLVLSPLLALMTHQLARAAAADPRLNSTIVGDALHVYSAVNVGFTIQSEATLYLGVVHDAAALNRREFVDRLGLLQRRAIAGSLRAADVTGATVSFSSMARWNVTRHMPVLPPHTALIVAHAASRDGAGTLGATYDHRVLTGYDALRAIQAVAAPEELS
jgi:pyruvate/2-oxoglutarate dehydrogenase complex dihydrolipoamide acyltransferase (E2) component